MSKITLTCFMLLIAIVAINAQTEEGTFLLSGQSSIGFNSTTTEAEGSGQETTITEFEVAPTAGYFILDHLVVGATFNLTFGNVEVANVDNRSSSFSLGPFGRYYFGQDNIRFFPQAGFGFFFGSQENGGLERDISGFLVNLGAGASFFLGDVVAFEALMKIDFGNQEIENERGFDFDQSIFDFDIGIGVSIFIR